ncbi:MAG: hypothetical protein M3P51_10535 [Chloroflexota bacterium]|nr:hypothetical protein [Chloroflexota bacterium]
MIEPERRIRQVATRIVFLLEKHPETTWEDVWVANERGGWTYEAYSDETGLVRVEGDKLEIRDLREAWKLARQMGAGLPPLEKLY